MRKVISDWKLVICPNCKGCGKMSCKDRDSVVHKLKTYECELCGGTGIVKRRVTVEHVELHEYDIE